MTPTTLEENTPAATVEPIQARTLILNAIGEGINTLRTIRARTGLDDATILREIDVLKGLYIEERPAPPFISYWMKGKVPARVVMENGNAVALKAEKTNRAKSELVQPPPPVETRNNPADQALAESFGLKAEDFMRAGADGQSTAERLCEIPFGLLEEHPDNPRGLVDEDEPQFHELVDSIRAVGVQEPLIVTPIYGTFRFRIVIGHRRKKAAIKAGLKSVPCIIRRFDSPEVEEDVMLIENIQRQNLKPVQEGKAFRKIYLRNNEDVNAVARRTGLTQSYIKGRMLLLRLDIGIQIMVDRGELGTTAAEILATLEPEQQKKLLTRAQRVPTAALRKVALAVKNAQPAKHTTSRKQQIQDRRVTTDEENFTRRGAIKSLENLGDAWFKSQIIIDAFDDTCLDTCLESKDETLCHTCPVPRMIASITRRAQKAQEAID